MKKSADRLKMNSEFWRGPQNVTGNNQNFPSPLMESSVTNQEYHLARNNSSDQFNTPNNAASTNNNNSSNVDNLNENNNRAVLDTKDQMLSASGIENQENFSTHSPNGYHQQQDTTNSSPVAENLSSDLKFNADKFVNEIQVSFSIFSWFFS